MDLEFSPEDLAFREEARTFIAQNYPAALRGKQDEGEELAKEDFLSWHRVLAKKGWIAPAWPKEYGGPGWTTTQRFIRSEELARADTLPILPFGINMVGPIITLGGEHEVNEVWLEDVRVPVDQRIYEENKGWTCAKFLLAHERTGIAGVARSKRGVERIKTIARTEMDGDKPLLANPFFK